MGAAETCVVVWLEVGVLKHILPLTSCPPLHPVCREGRLFDGEGADGCPREQRGPLAARQR